MYNDKWNEMIRASKFKDMKGFGLAAKGKIALQDHGDKVWYRNIKIKVLQNFSEFMVPELVERDMEFLLVPELAEGTRSFIMEPSPAVNTSLKCPPNPQGV